MIRNQFIWGISLSFLMISIALAEKPAIDPNSGMIIDKNWQLVRSLCSSCHSAKQFLQQNLDKNTWEEVIDRMKKRGLPELDSDTRSKIIDYLAKNYNDKTKKESQPTDPNSGMIIDENWQLVRSLCSSCHSAKQFLQQHLDKSTWEEVIDWMKEQGLPELDSDTKSKIVDYLAKNYGYETKKETAN